MTPPLTVPKTTAIRPPKVYLAGKIRKNCWRYSLVSGLRAHHWDQGDLPRQPSHMLGPTSYPVTTVALTSRPSTARKTHVFLTIQSQGRR